MGQDENGNPEAPRAPSIFYRGSAAQNSSSDVSRSFSTRAKDLPAALNVGVIDERISPVQEYNTQRRRSTNHPLANVPITNVSEAFIPAQDSRKLSSPFESMGPASPTGANSTERSGKERRDWASDRSPLQKLEVTLGGMSKEEKRARAQEAEKRLKERLARQEADDNNREHMSQPQGRLVSDTPKYQPRVPEPTIPNRMASRGQTAMPPKGVMQAPKQVHTRSYSTAGGFPEIGPQRHAQKSNMTQNIPRRLSVGYAAVTPATQPQFATAEHYLPQVEIGNQIPRRPVGAGNKYATYATGVMPARKPATIMAAAVNTEKSQSLPKWDPQSFPDRPIQQVTQDKGPSRNVSFQAQITSASSMNVAERDFAAIGPDLNKGTSGDDNAVLQDTNDRQGAKPKQKKQSVSFNVPPPTPPPLSEWKNAPVARLCNSDFDFQDIDLERSKAWWSLGGSTNRRESRSLPKNYQKPAQQTTLNERFRPQIFLKCGPLLRYAGMKRVKIDGPNGPIEKATWRGSVMIVTKDSLSSYEPSPRLRLFSQPMDILPPPPSEVQSQLAFEYVDPTAGLMKVGRDGRPLYVKPVDDTEEDIDLSFVENDDGLYEQSPSRVEFNNDDNQQSIPANRIHPCDGETAGLYKEIPGIRLYADPDRDVTFWRFSIEVELGSEQRRVAYRINQGPALGFWVPASGQSMNIAFYTCNGFGLSADPNKFCGPDPLWRDILNEHQTRPFHVMIGGGDQIFNDSVISESIFFQEWVKTKNIHEKYNATFSPEFRSDLENYYLERYSIWFSQGLYSLANSQIPMVNMWNDHELIEGFGSYPDEFMRTSVISGLGRIAFKYYLLFQHQSVLEETEADEPSWILGAQPGPYIKQKSRNLFMPLGKDITLLALDCRTERISSEVLTEETCDLIWDRCHREIVKGEIKHLIVVSSIPIIYPRVAMVKNILNSRKSLGKAGIFGGFVNKYGGRVEIFDDHWTAKHLKPERGWLIEDLQDLAAEKSIRITILSGDVHLAAIGRFYSSPKLDIRKDRDYRYMPNVISSAIADVPESDMIADMLNTRNKVHHMDADTEEDIIPIFTQDVDGKPRNNKRLLPRRNWCSIRPYQPGSTPPATPGSLVEPNVEEPRPAKLQRTMSLTRGDSRSGGGLLRRLSQRSSRPPTREFNLGGAANRRRMSMDGPFPPPETGDSYFPQPPGQRPNPFLRRPTDVSLKAAKRAARQGKGGVGAPINLEGGLAITLNLEVNPGDPSGITYPYKLLVPMLWYDEPPVHTEPDASHIPVATAPPAKAPKRRSWAKWLGVGRNKNTGTTDEERFSGDEGVDAGDPQIEHGANYEGYPGSDEDDESFPEEVIPPEQLEGSIENTGPEGRGPKKRWFQRM